MALTRIEIHGYRGFREIGVLDFAVPNGEAGSGLTVLTGQNNAGSLASLSACELGREVRSALLLEPETVTLSW